MSNTTYISFNNWRWLEAINCLDEVEVLSGDVRDPHYCKHITQNIEVVFHLAALIAIPYSYVAPTSYVDTNITGSLNICQAALDNGVEKIIHTSTSEIYGTAPYVPIDEKHPLQPQLPYSASKIGADNMAMSFYNAFDLPVATARPFKGTCRGFLAIAKSDQTIGETINIGSNFETSIADTFNMIKKVMNSAVDFVVDPLSIRPSKSEVQRLWCDNKKINALTGFKPEYSIEEGIHLTADWFTDKEKLSKYKSQIYKAQIYNV
ncbi:MAG: GDP-mannose 4,6-dehydratase [Pseudomonadales bacterium]|nr:GDP-mannose 4,6-dehydratase [Pseudomonadales bacterium]